MEVFISWSGSRSEKVAVALRDWLPSVIQSVTPFMSASDIEKGSRWSGDLAAHLEQAQFGLICLTPDNLEAPWLLFEAGALSESIENSRVVPYLHGVSQAMVQGPLAQFQAAVADKSSTLDVIKSINEAAGENRLELSRLEHIFETWWPQLEQTLASIPDTAEEAPPTRTERDILEEILGLCRQMSRLGIPSLDSEQEFLLRSLSGIGFYTDPVDSPEGFDAERLLSDSERRRRTIERFRNRQEIERRRRSLEEHLRVHQHPSPERDDPSSNDG